MSYQAAHMTLVMDRMTEIMSIQHVFDDQVDQPDGGPLKYVLEVGADRFAVFRSDRTGDDDPDVRRAQRERDCTGRQRQ